MAVCPPGRCAAPHWFWVCNVAHQNDPTILERWLSNKTPAIVSSWIAAPDNHVSPHARFRGVNRSLLGALEAGAMARGNARCTLNSTTTALRFYLRKGCVSDGPPTQEHETGGYPMSKPLTPHNP